jgi:hypothetical protein
MNIKINERALKRIENSQVGPIVGKHIEKKIIQGVNQAHREMIKEFESHPVTKEIESGPEGWNESGTLGGYGNLYSYIGFEEGMDPITPIRLILKKALNIKSIPSSQRSMILKFQVELPSKEEIFSASPMPWVSGRSWAEGIEKGISGLGNYINRMTLSGRSGQGIQTKNKVRSGQFRNTKYLSNILNNLKININRSVK